MEDNRLNPHQAAAQKAVASFLSSIAPRLKDPRPEISVSAHMAQAVLPPFILQTGRWEDEGASANARANAVINLVGSIIGSFLRTEGLTVSSTMVIGSALHERMMQTVDDYLKNTPPSSSIIIHEKVEGVGHA